MAYRFIISILFILNGPLFSQESGVKTEAQLTFEQGLHTADLSKKIALFEKTLRINPEHQPALYRLGITYYRMGDYLKTVQTLSKVYEIEDSQKETSKLYLRNAFGLLAKDFIEQEQYDSAQNAAKDALDIEPDYSPALTALGSAQYYSGNYNAAIASLKKSIALDSLQDEAWNKLGDVYLRTKTYPDAIFAYQRAISLNQNLQEAKFHLDIVRKRCTPEFLLKKAHTANSVNEVDEAIHILKQGQKLYPHDEKIGEELAHLEHGQNYRQSLEAIDSQSWQTALELLANLPADYQNTALLLDEVNTKLAQPVSDEEISQNSSSEIFPPNAPRENKIDDIEVSEEKPVTNQNIVRVEAPAELGAIAVQQLADSTIPPTQNSQQLASADVMVIPADSLSQSFAEIQPKPTAPTPDSITAPQSSSQSNFWYGLTLGTAAMTFLIFLFVKNRGFLRQKQQSLFKKYGWLKSGEHTDELMKIASETPVKYGNIGTSDLLEATQTTENAGHPDENLRHLMETKTIVGGIKKMRRIGRYVIEKEIGRGSMGLVFKAWDPKLERTIVIKQVIFNKDKYIELSLLHDRLLREARAAGKLNHPNIVVIYDVEQDKNFSFIVMEYVEGDNLKSVLEKQINLNAQRAINITKQICSALAFAHENDIIHRDIKPSNIILTNKDIVKVADFGIAKLPQLETLTQTDDIVGTPFYMSPEQIEGRKVDGRSDVFSTGVVLYEILTGTRPFQGDNIPSIVYKIVHKTPKIPSQKQSSIPKSFDEVIKKALAKEPEKRYQSAMKFAQALETIGESIQHEV